MPIDLERAWTTHERVALRPEPFGALAYDFDTRRLSFLKSRKLLDVVRSLGDHPTARDACAAAGVTERELPAYMRALEALADARMIRERAA